MRVTIKMKLAAVFALVIILMMAAAAWSISSLGTINDAMDGIVTRTAERVRLAEEIKSDLLAIVRAEKNMILEDNVDGMRKFADAADKGREPGCPAGS